MQRYYITHLRDGAINLGDRVVTEIVGTYQQAVDLAHQLWRGLRSKSAVTVHADEWCLYFYHAIWSDGRAEDRNTNSGVKFTNEVNLLPAYEKLQEWAQEAAEIERARADDFDDDSFTPSWLAELEAAITHIQDLKK